VIAYRDIVVLQVQLPIASYSEDQHKHLIGDVCLVGHFMMVCWGYCVPGTPSVLYAPEHGALSDVNAILPLAAYYCAP
jgi:hypothetical protein